MICLLSIFTCAFVRRVQRQLPGLLTVAVERTCKREQVVCRGYVLGDASARHVLVRSSILTCTAAVGRHGFLFCIVARGYSEQEYVFFTVKVHVDSAAALLGQFYWKTAKVAFPGVELLR